MKYGFCVFLLLLSLPAVAGKKADLVVDGSQIEPYVSIENFAADDCEVNEGCATSGTRILLRFTTYTRNQGRSDVKLGDPAKRPDLFTYDDCHGHYHFNGYMDYELLNDQGVVAIGHKAAFCLLDLDRWRVNARKKAKFNCDYQGIQAGWADIYDAALPCQYIDVTDVPDGDYVLQMQVNPDLKIQESDYSNNITTVGLHLEKPVIEPPVPVDNDNLVSATVVGPGIYHGDARFATNEGNVTPSCGAAGSPDVWFRYTPSEDGQTTISTCGADYDTVLTLYRDDAGTLTEIACNDDSTCNISSLISRVSAAVSAHEKYVIRIASFGSKAGKYQLTLDGPPAE